MVYVIRIWLEKIKETENQAKVMISQGLYITAFFSMDDLDEISFINFIFSKYQNVLFCTFHPNRHHLSNLQVWPVFLFQSLLKLI